MPRKGHGPAGWDQTSSAEKNLQLMFSPAQGIWTYNLAHCPAVLLLSPKTHPLYDLPLKFLHSFFNFPISLKTRLFVDFLFRLSISKASLHLLCCLFLSVPPSSTATAGLTVLHLALRSFTKAVCLARFTTNAACNPRGTSFIPAPHPP